MVPREIVVCYRGYDSGTGSTGSMVEADIREPEIWGPGQKYWSAGGRLLSASSWRPATWMEQELFYLGHTRIPNIEF